jgi:pyruvate-formate lyase-activating enzyme
VKSPIPSKIFHLILIKPSHYDDEGYVIQWVRSSIPSNTMAAIYGLARDCVERQVLGSDVQVSITALDENNTRIKPRALARMVQQTGGQGLIAMVGVQTNQFPRAMDLAREFRRSHLNVCIGGFHVSGCLAMLPIVPPDLQEAMSEGISLFAGEAEGHLDNLLQDAYSGQLQPLYNVMKDPPGLGGQPVPYLPAHLVHRMSGARTSFDAGRGCPFLCSFCTIINVQGRKSRFRSPDDIEELVKTNLSQDIHKFFVTDDNFARNQAWEPILDRLIQLREQEGLQFKITIQVDTMCHKIPRFIEKAGRAGVDRVFIGLESINPDSLEGSRKHQNKITEYRSMLQAWHQVGALTLAGLILGFPTDTPESITRDIQIIQKELPIDLLYFFILTPLPGSQDHKELYQQGVALATDMNTYDSVHVTMPHARMSDEELLAAYHQAWDIYYSPEHVETVIRRARAWQFSMNKVKWMMLSFYAAAKVEGVHPMDSGIFRRKYRGDRRVGLPKENLFLFYARYGWEIASKHLGYIGLYLKFHRAYRHVMQDSITGENDVAMQPVQVEELDTLELFTATSAAQIVVEKIKKKNAGPSSVVPIS